MNVKIWTGLTLTILMLGGITPAVAQSKPKPPSIKVVCNVLAADVTLTFHSPEGDKVAPGRPDDQIPPW